MTQASFDELSAELKYLWKEKRPEVTQKVSEAAAQGDRSENAEYIYGKKQLREIDGRIRYLSKTLDNANVITRLPEDKSRVFFGAWVTIVADVDQSPEHTTEQRLRLVGADEAGKQPGYISIDSPMARALLGKRIDDDISVNGPTGTSEYQVVNIEYLTSPN